MDINNLSELKSQGYKKSVYYCGNYSLQKTWTKLMGQLQKRGVQFPFNRACFIHDKGYSSKPTVVQKIKIDKEFFDNMVATLDHMKLEKKEYAKLYTRAVIYYGLVILMTPLYMFQGKIR